MPRVRVRTGADIGRAISELRIRRAMTQAELAEKTGLTPSYVSKIESGRTSTILEHELRILRRLGASITIELRDGSD